MLPRIDFLLVAVLTAVAMAVVATELVAVDGVVAQAGMTVAVVVIASGCG